jgi:hypothetical protein
MSKNDPAFPQVDVIASGQGGVIDLRPNFRPTPGLTKLEWFAAMALQGMCAGKDFSKPVDCVELSQFAFAVAEFMVKEAEKRK